MTVICSWCRQEGKAERVGEKVPLEDERETHGICLAHWQAVVEDKVGCQERRR